MVSYWMLINSTIRKPIADLVGIGLGLGSKYGRVQELWALDHSLTTRSRTVVSYWLLISSIMGKPIVDLVGIGLCLGSKYGSTQKLWAIDHSLTNHGVTNGQ